MGIKEELMEDLEKEKNEDQEENTSENEAPKGGKKMHNYSKEFEEMYGNKG